MDEQKLQFRVGLLTISALTGIVFMVFQFGEISNSLSGGTEIEVVAQSASGIVPDTPVRLSGVRIGRVRDIRLLKDGIGVAMRVLIDPDYSFRNDSEIRIARGLLGDATLEIRPGRDGELIQTGDRLRAASASDPTAVLGRMEDRVGNALQAFELTGRQWGRLAENLNHTLETRGPDGLTILDRSERALTQLTSTLNTAEQALASTDRILGDPRTQQQLRQSLLALPRILVETQQTLTSVRSAVQEVEATASNMTRATAPFAERGTALVQRTERTLSNLEILSQQFAQLSAVMNREDGPLRQLLSDPAMYRNLHESTRQLSGLLSNLQPVISDLRIFSDAIARHPELLGVRGVVRGSSGVKENDIRPAAFETSNK